MIRVRYSNRIEQLVGALAQALPPPGDLAALFDGPWLVVAGRPLELFVDLEVARRRGVSGSVDTLSVKGAFARLCARATPEVTLIERGHLVGELLALLSDAALVADPAMAALRDYLMAAGPAADAVGRRRVDLARALAALFDGWALTRPERAAEWRAATPDGAAVVAPLERAERVLWARLFGPGGRFERRGTAEGRRYLTLEGLLDQGLDAAWRPPAAVHVFAAGEIPRGLQLALARLGSRTDLSLYAVNPCREFWEDVDTRAAARPRRTSTGAAAPAGRIQRRKVEASRQLDLLSAVAPHVPSPAAASADTGRPEETEPAPPQDNPLLRVWGHAGREDTRLINQLSDGDFDDLFVPPTTDSGGGADSAEATSGRATILAWLQRDLLDRRPTRDGGDVLNLPADGSVVVLGAPNPRRELESIAGQIWEMVRAADDAGRCGGERTLPLDNGAPSKGPSEILLNDARAPLRFSDIAVMIAGADQPYLSLAQAVFREARDLPHCVVDQPLSHTSPLVEAVLALLTLPLGTLSRREVLDVITHPNVRARFPDAEPHVWLQLCEGLAIAHGADQAALSDTYIDADVFNWDQGIKRLALGVFACGPRSGLDDAVSLPGAPAPGPTQTGAGPVDSVGAGAYVPAEVSAELRPTADALALLVRSLLADARFARAARLAIPQWAAFVRALMSAYVVPTTPDDELARLRLFTALDQLANEAPADVPVPLGTAAELVRGALDGLRGARGQILGAGVPVGTLASLRSIPFRVVFVVGLTAERFPATDRPSPFDVEADRARAGDVSGRQRDRYLMLEALLAARERLVLSYVDRDARTGDPREPSAVVLELMEVVQRGYLRPGASVASNAPLHRDEDEAVHLAIPAAAAEARARRWGQELQAAVPAISGWAPVAVVRALAPDVRAGLAGTLRTIALDAAPAARPGTNQAPGAGPRVLQMVDLRRFLECPLQGSARVVLGLRDLPDDTEARETGDEPFEVPRLMERALLAAAFQAAWTGADLPQLDRLEAAYDATATRHRHGRSFPAGLFRASVRRRHLRILEQWRASIATHDALVRGPAERGCFGRPDPAVSVRWRRPAIRLAVPEPGGGGGTARIVEIHGTTEPQVTWSRGGSGSLVLTTSSSTDKEKDEKDSLRVFLDQVMLAAARVEDPPPQDVESLPSIGGAIVRPAREAMAPPPFTPAWAPLEPGAARAYLAALAAELLGGVHPYLFPCEAVFRFLRGGAGPTGEPMSLVDRIDQVRADKFYRERSSSNWGPIPDPFDYPTPDAATAERLAEARFGLWARQVQSGPAARHKGKRGAA